jgi:hypothetical protein
MKIQLIITLITLLLIPGICSADNYVGGIPPTTVKEGTVSGGVYFDSYYGSVGQANYKPITMDKTFTLPSYTDIEWAMLLTTVYCGHMENNYQGVANVTFNGVVLGNETLNVPFVFRTKGGDGYVWVNDHLNRVSSDYMMWYDVTNLIQAGDNTASVHTNNQTDSGTDPNFDGRIKLITLIVAYNDSSGSTIHYWINRGHDLDSYYSDQNLGEDYIGSTTFTASLPLDTALLDAHLTVVHMASNDSVYTFNGNSIASSTPQGTYSGSNIWDITGGFDLDGTNTLTYSRSPAAPFYKIALGIITAEYQDSAADTDLLISDITVKHNYHNGAWANLSNAADITVENSGTGDAGSFNVALYADDTEVDTISVAGLAAGASTVVNFDWTPEEVKTYTLRAEADTGDAVAESDETNNNYTKSQDVGYNGYIGDKPLTTYAHEIITGDILYTYGSSFYSGKLFSSDTYTVNHDITLPAGASVKFARLYSYWTWSGVGTTGKYPTMSLTFDGSTLTPEVKYEDKKGWGLSYDYPAGTWAYDVTGIVTESGTYTTVVTNTDSEEGSYFCMDGLGMLVVYEDPNGQIMEYWINEGADMLSTSDTSGGIMSDEAIAISRFEGSVNLSIVDSARLWTVVQSGGHLDNSLLFNSQSWTGVYDSTPYSDLDIDEARAVGNYLTTSDNTAMIKAGPYSSGGDYLVPSNAFLIINYTETPPLMLSISADPTTVTVGVPTDVTFNVTSYGSPVEGAALILSGYATGSGTTDANGTAIISVNATDEGDITATASKEGYISTTATLTAESGTNGVSSSVSLSVDIIPAVGLVVTPGSIDFGVLSTGETSGGHTITLENTGGFNIDVTADVADTANNLFMDGFLLDSGVWSIYNTSIAAAGSDTAVALLDVPVDYIGVGDKEGTLVFWAQKT